MRKLLTYNLSGITLSAVRYAICALMYKYELIIFWSEEDQRYLVEVPELPGCMADGQTYEEAIQNAQVIILLEWIDTAKSLGREIPQPKGKLAYA